MPKHGQQGIISIRLSTESHLYSKKKKNIFKGIQNILGFMQILKLIMKLIILA